MNHIDYYLSWYMFLTSCVMFCLYFKFLLLLIISLEFIVISVMFNMYMIFMISESSMFLFFMILIFFVCEGALSLSLIVLVVRFYGNDYINSLMILKW